MNSLVSFYEEIHSSLISFYEEIHNLWFIYIYHPKQRLLNYGCLFLFSRQMDSAASISPSSCLNVSIRFLVWLVLFLFSAIRAADPSSPTDNP